jgi:hypothetical protein
VCHRKLTVSCTQQIRPRRIESDAEATGGASVCLRFFRKSAFNLKDIGGYPIGVARVLVFIRASSLQ